jgi:hypothetical protein
MRIRITSSGSRHHADTRCGGGRGGSDTHGRAVFDQAMNASPTGRSPPA